MMRCRKWVLTSLVVIGTASPVLLAQSPSGLEAGISQEQEASAAQEGPGAPPTAQAEGEAGSSIVMMTDEEERALRLVEEILREQQMILAGQNFIYRSEGRRDPFRNILALRRRELVAPTERPPGLAGFLISEIDVDAAALFQGRWHVLVTGLDQRTYTATVGTVLYDGRVVSVSMNEVVFEQEVEDLLGARSTRQVIKKLNEDQD